MVGVNAVIGSMAASLLVLDDPGRAALIALCGGGVGFGIFLLLRVTWGLRGGRVIGRRAEEPARRRGLVRVGVAVAVAVTIGVLTGWVVGALLAALGSWFLPRLLGRDRAHERRVARIEAVATWTEMIRDTLSAAAGLEQAVLATATLSPPAIREEVAVLAAGLHRGERLVPALRRFAEDLADPTADLVVAALVMAAEQQARQLADLLGALAATARERASMRMRVEAGRARSRTSVRVIIGTTCTFAALIVVIDRDYIAAYDSVTGQIVLLVIGLLFALGFSWLARIAAVPEPDRLLGSDDPAVGAVGARAGGVA